MIKCICSDWEIELNPKTRSHLLDVNLMFKRVEPREFITKPKKLRIIWMEKNVVKAFVSKYLWWNDNRVEELYWTLDSDTILQQLPEIIKQDIWSNFENGIEKVIAGMSFVKSDFPFMDDYLFKYYKYLASKSPVIKSPSWIGNFYVEEENIQKLWENYTTDRPCKKLWKYKVS